MPQFQTIEQAFEWFLENTYPQLTTEQKQKLRDAKHDYTTGRSKVSQKRMMRIMDEYGEFEIQYIYENKK
ncbi:MAG TPA: hypothetical protein DCS93_35810 [Microscillaceae bacterium]|nr:hypothetical protein [Microscillaceae bacterium]